MLSNHLLKDKTYENLIEEARMQIPLYTKEWTNFNSSDPAVTTLEAFSLFTILQQDSIDRIPEIVQEKVFALAGIQKNREKGARVLLKATNVSNPVAIPAGQKFQVGDMFFETNHENHIFGDRLVGVYSKYDEKIMDFSYLLDEDVPLKASVFSDKPKKNMEIYFVMDGIQMPGTELIFHIDIEQQYRRNEITDTLPFAKIQWQCYTEKGFRNIRHKDYTEGFLRSGELRFRLPKETAAVYTELPQEGYVIRGILQEEAYDIPPKLQEIHGFLFEVWQKDTMSICYTFAGQDRIEVFSDILEDGYWQMFCREEGSEGYYLYENAGNGERQGRFYRVNKLGFGKYEFKFDKEQFGYGPGNYVNAIKFVAYNEDMMQQFYLGQMYGYDSQRIELPLNNVVKEGFSLMAKREDAKGNAVYEFVKPDSDKETEFFYQLKEIEGAIIIEDARDFVGAKLYMCGSAKTRGEEGNLRKGSVFSPVGYESQIRFVNPAPGSGGRLLESLEDLRYRFIQDLNEHYTAVEAKDYENIVKSTPGLCIDKVKAVMDKQKNQIQITVKPYSMEPYPKLSKQYQKIINDRLEARRLLTTKIELHQPAYAEVAVQGVIYVKPHYEGSREQIEAVIRRELDYIHSEKNFGERLYFDELFHRIEALDCVDFIYELIVTPQNQQLAYRQGLDIVPLDYCLLIPGNIKLEINTM